MSKFFVVMTDKEPLGFGRTEGEAAQALATRIEEYGDLFESWTVHYADELDYGGEHMNFTRATREVSELALELLVHEVDQSIPHDYFDVICPGAFQNEIDGIQEAIDWAEEVDQDHKFWTR